MIQHVAYRQEHFDTPARCVSGIRDLIALGWNVVEVRGSADGPFLVVCRKDDAA